MWCACGDDSGSGVAAETYIDTGIAPDRNVADLSAAEKQRLCEEVAEAALGVLQDPRIADGFCTLAGIAGSLLVPAQERERACEEFVAACTTPATFPDLTVLGANCGDPSPTCDATVGEIEACSNAAIGSLDAFYLNLTCSGVAELTVVPALARPATGCASVQAHCPDLYAVPATITATPTTR
jgi:hypothetical protein